MPEWDAPIEFFDIGNLRIDTTTSISPLDKFFWSDVISSSTSPFEPLMYKKPKKCANCGRTMKDRISEEIYCDNCI